MSQIAIKIKNLKKQYRLGVIGGGTLSADLQSWWARINGKEDPNLQIGKTADDYNKIFWALNGINLEIKKGEAVGIIGANGAGKSTLLKILSRVTAPTDGDIWYEGRISSMLEVGTGFHGELTGRENIYMNGAILGMNKKEVDSKIEEIIEFSECKEFIDTPVKRYSSGMYVKLAFAVAAHLDAEIMIMDEVLAVGDMQFQKKSLDKMSESTVGGKKTILYVSHNMATIQRLCTRCIVLDKGKVIYDGDVNEAIKTYISSQVETSPYLKLSNVERYDNNSQKVKMISFRILDRENATIKMKEKIRCELVYEIIQRVDVMCLKMIFRYIDTTVAGLAVLRKVNGGEPGEIKKVVFEFLPSSLAPGEYDYRFALIEVSNTGTETGHDTLMYCGRMTILQDIDDVNNLNWYHNTYGHAYLGDLQFVSN